MSFFIPSTILWSAFDMGDFLLNQEITHILMINTDQYYEKIKNRYSELLAPHELQKAERFLKPHLKHGYIARKYLLRSLLSTVLKIRPEEIIYQQTGKKKPHVTGCEFNSSHSGSYAFIALSPRPVGIDAEMINTSFQFEPMIKHCFNEAEIAALASGDRQTNFFGLWTRKESILKATAEGLVDDLREVACLGETIHRKGKVLNVYSFQINNAVLLSIAGSSTLTQIRFWSL